MDPFQSPRLSPNRISQESKVTSTPISAKAILSTDDDVNLGVPTPSISNISKPATSVITSSHNSSSQSIYFDDSELNDDSESVCDDDYINVLKKAKQSKAGTFWRTFKPKHDDTLYNAILTDPINSDTLAAGLVKKFLDEPEFYMHAIIKLLVDVSGYQNLKIDTLYNVEKCNPEDLIEHMQKLALDTFLVSKSKALFLLDDHPGKTSIVFKSAVYHFFHTLILKSHDEDILYGEFFYKNIFETVRSMASSSMRNIRKTGIMVALKLMTGCFVVYHKVERKILDSQTRDCEELNNHKTMIKHHMSYFYSLIVLKNALIPDKQCYDIRRECAHEIASWAKYAPEYTLSQTKCVTILLKLLQDESPKVRMTVLDTLKILISSEEFKNYISPKIEPIIEVIANRIYDVDLKIAIKSCDLLCLILKFYTEYFQQATFIRLLRMVYNKNYELSRIASKVTITGIRSDKTPNPSEEILLKLAIINQTPVYVGQCRLLVESVMEFVPELKSCDLFVTLLKKSNDYKICRSLLEVLYESISFYLSDRPLLRTVPAHTKTLVFGNESLNEAITSEYIPHVNVLLHKFDNNVESLTFILKIILLIKHDRLEEDYTAHYVDIIKKVIRILLSSSSINSEMLFEKCTEVLSLLCDNMSDRQNQSIVFVDGLIVKLVEEFHSIRNDWVESKTNKNKTKLIIVISKIAKLFKHFDLTKHLSWEDVFISNKEEIDILAHYQSSSMSYLIWNMRNAFENQNDLARITELIHAYDDYLNTAFRILNKKECNVLCFETYASICDLLYAFHKYLKHDTTKKLSPSFETLLVSLPKEHILSLTSFLEDNIILAPVLPQEKKMLYISKLVDLLNLNVLPFTYFASIFRFYDSHYNEYQLLFKDIISKIQNDQGALILTIMNTLVKCYEKIIIINNHIDANNKDFKSLCDLAKKFSSLKLSISEDLLPFVNMGLVYSLKFQRNYMFLHLLKFFVETLEPKKKTTLLNKLKDLVTEDSRTDDVVLFFSKILKKGLKVE